MNRKPTRCAICSSRHRSGPVGSERVGQASRTKSGRNQEDQRPQKRDLNRLGEHGLSPCRPDSRDQVAPHDVQEDDRQHQAERMPGLQRQMSPQAAGLGRFVPGLKRPVGDIKSPPNQELNQEKREQDQDVVDHDPFAQAPIGTNQFGPADGMNDPAVDQEREDREQPRRQSVVYDGAARANSQSAITRNATQNPRPNARAATRVIPPNVSSTRPGRRPEERPSGEDRSRKPAPSRSRAEWATSSVNAQ